MRDLIEQWKALANEHRSMGNLHVTVAIERVIEELEQRLDQLAEGLAEPTGDGSYFVEGLGICYVRRWYGGFSVDCRIERGNPTLCGFSLDGRRVWPVIDPRKGGV